MVGVGVKVGVTVAVKVAVMLGEAVGVAVFLKNAVGLANIYQPNAETIVSISKLSKASVTTLNFLLLIRFDLFQT